MPDGSREDLFGFFLRADLAGDRSPSEEGVRQLNLECRIVGLLFGEGFVVGERELQELFAEGLHSGLIEEIILADHLVRGIDRLVGHLQGLPSPRRGQPPRHATATSRPSGP